MIVQEVFSMNTQESRHPVTYARNTRRKKRPLEVDLNVAPPAENRYQGGITDVESLVGLSVQQGSSTLHPPIDLEALDDDDVIISSPRAFAEAKNKAGRPHGRAIVVDVDSINSGPSSRAARSKRRRGPALQEVVNGDLYINLEASGYSRRDSVKKVNPCVPPPLPPPKEPVFTCPVCMGTLVEEMSTKCGHIFCKACIKAAIAAQNKCPTCRRKISMKDTIRVYLPTN